MSARWFMNLPAMSDVAAVDAAATKLGAYRVAGYRGFDGLRANIEITPDAAAEEIAAQAKQIEQQARALRAFADGRTTNV